MAKLLSVILLFVLITLLGVRGSSAGAQIADFYRGKTLRIIVGFPPGGGADVYSRLIARHLGQHIPGNPTVIVSNSPGAGSIIAANQLYNTETKDGTVIGNINGAVILEQLFNNPAIQFDMGKFRYLAVPVNETYVMITARSLGITKFEDLLGPNARQVVLGAIPGSTLEHAPILLRETLGANLKIVSGYKGTADIRLAIDAGEIGGFFNPWSTIKPSSLDKFKNGIWTILAQLTVDPLSDLPVPSVPTILDLTKHEDNRRLLRYGTSAPNQFGKVYAVAPGVPEDRVAVLELAFTKTFADKRFLTEAENAKLEISPRFGESIQRIVMDFLSMPSEIRLKLQKMLKPAKP